ncbi:MAG: ATP-grasp domain-containing protein [Thermodesulfobacteriota bacterium]
MILSYHPCFAGDENRLCAGRAPDQSDLRRMARADVVILPQGAQQALYEMAVAACPRVFPDYRVRFAYPGKCGQIRLFREIGAPHPQTWIYKSLAAYPGDSRRPYLPPELELPCIFKFDWGGEGDNVRCIKQPADLAAAIADAEAFEKTGQTGFLLQRQIPCGSASLRVVTIDREMISYWRIQQGPNEFRTGLSRGAAVDAKAWPEHQAAGCEQVRRVCAQTGINLAGFDLLFDVRSEIIEPYVLEINYFFGRKGLGGSRAFYERLERQIRSWLQRNGLRRPEMIEQRTEDI